MTLAVRTGARRWCWQDPTVVVVVIVIAYLPYLLGLVQTGVMGFNSGLATIPVGPWLGLHPGLPWLDPNVGYVSQAMGHLAANDLIHGRIPWWNPYEAVGVPLAGEGQSAALFPLTPLLALPDGQLYFHLALQLIAGVATQRLLKEMGMARWVTVAGAIVFGLNGTFAWLTNAAFDPVAFLPVILWGIERCRTRSPTEGWSGWLLVAGGLALSIYAGFPETAYIDGLLAAAWALLRLFQQPAGRRIRYAGAVGLGGAIGLLASAPFFAAFASATHKADLGGHLHAFATAHLPTQAVSTLGLPYLYGPLFGYKGATHQLSLTALWGGVGGFVTAAVVAVALLGLFAGRNRGLRILLAAWIAVTLAKSFGVTPIVHLVNLIPGISSVAFGRYAPPSWEMAFTVLAALGLQAVGDAAPAQALRVKTALCLAAASTLVAIGAELAAARGLLRAAGKDTGIGSVPVGAEVWALSTVMLVVIVGLAARPRLAQWAMGTVLATEALFMFMTPELSAPGRIPLDLRPVTYLQQHLGRFRFVTLGPIVPNYGSYFQISEANAHDLPIPGAWATFVSHNLEPNELPQQFTGTTSLDPKAPTPIRELEMHLSAYESIGVKYVVVPSEWGGLPGKVVFADRDTKIWELPHPAPFYWVLSGSCHVRGLSLTEFRAVCTQPSEVVRSELAAPGWKAETNGVPTPIIPAGPLFGLVKLPAGTSTVRFSFLPPRMALCADLFLGGIALGVGAVIARLVVRRRRRRPRARHMRQRGRRFGTPIQSSLGSQ